MQYRPVTIWLPRFRLPRRISLRMLLMLITLVAVSLAWLSDHRRLAQENDRLLAQQTPWSASQLLGPPDAAGSSDNRNAWASATQDGQQEWVVIEFTSPTNADAVLIYENYNPGAVSRVSTWDPAGEEVTLWEGVDPTPKTASRGVSELPVAADHPIDRIKIYLNSMQTPGWNEIDAVGLRDQQGQIQWAQNATVSSAYGGAPTRSGRMIFTF